MDADHLLLVLTLPLLSRPHSPTPHNGSLALPHIQLPLVPRVLGKGQRSQDINGRIRFSREDHHPLQAPGERPLPHIPQAPLNKSHRSEKSSLPSQVSLAAVIPAFSHRRRGSKRARYPLGTTQMIISY